MKITHIQGQELRDSRGNSTVEAIVFTEDGARTRAMVPSGASRGRYEALELRDGGPHRYLGREVLLAVRNVNDVIGPALEEFDVTDQHAIDHRMIELDGTRNKSHLGANAILAVSIACPRAASYAKGIPFCQHIAEFAGRPMDEPYIMPVPMINILNGGKHAIGSSDFQEYMIVPIAAPTIAEAIHFSLRARRGVQPTDSDREGPRRPGRLRDFPLRPHRRGSPLPQGQSGVIQMGKSAREPNERPRIDECSRRSNSRALV